MRGNQILASGLQRLLRALIDGCWRARRGGHSGWVTQSLGRGGLHTGDARISASQHCLIHRPAPPARSSSSTPALGPPSNYARVRAFRPRVQRTGVYVCGLAHSTRGVFSHLTCNWQRAVSGGASRSGRAARRNTPWKHPSFVRREFEWPAATTVGACREPKIPVQLQSDSPTPANTFRPSRRRLPTLCPRRLRKRSSADARAVMQRGLVQCLAQEVQAGHAAEAHVDPRRPVSLRLLRARQDGRPSDDASDCRVTLRELGASWALRSSMGSMSSMGGMQPGGFDVVVRLGGRVRGGEGGLRPGDNKMLEAKVLSSPPSHGRFLCSSLRFLPFFWRLAHTWPITFCGSTGSPPATPQKETPPEAN